jgi:glucose/arabinose dehydrogenase
MVLDRIAPVGACAAVLGVLTAAGIAGGQSIPHGLVIEQRVGEPFDSSPVGFAFLPDGRVLVLEKNTGNVRLSAVGSTTSVVILTIPGVAPSFEGGLLGVAVDPQWPKRPYAYFMSDQSSLVLHVTRYRASGALEDPSSTDLVLDSPYKVLDDLPDQQGIHQGGTLRFGIDGCLYVSLGDDGTPCDAQAIDVLKGKILRIDVRKLPDAGTGPPAKAVIAPADNPFVGGGDNAALVWAYGFRNPFRFTVDARIGDLWIGDVGENTWEEIDHVVFSGTGGNNFGWPEFEGQAPDPIAGADSCSTGPFAAPVYTYAHPLAQPASVVAGPIHRTVPASTLSLPPEYDGNAFVADVYGGWIRRFERGTQGWHPAPAVPGQPDPVDWATDLGAISDMQSGPEGALYFMVLYDGATLGRGLYRIADAGPTDVAGAIVTRGSRAVPNPTHAGSATTIRCAPAGAGAPVVTIYDAAGRWVRELRGDPGGAGTVAWDGRDARGAALPAGIYVYRIGGRDAASGKIAIVR